MRKFKFGKEKIGRNHVHKALYACKASADYAPINFIPFEEAYKTLTEKLQPMVYELGFLKV